jgi:hypothetical protein
VVESDSSWQWEIRLKMQIHLHTANAIRRKKRFVSFQQKFNTSGYGKCYDIFRL